MYLLCSIYSTFFLMFLTALCKLILPVVASHVLKPFDLKISSFKEILALSSRLANTNFTEKAPGDIVQDAKQKLSDAKIQVDLVRKRLKDLE